MKHIYKKYIFILITLLYTHYTQCAEEEYTLPCVTDMIPIVSCSLDLCAVSRLLRTCKTYHDIYNAEISYKITIDVCIKTKEDIEKYKSTIKEHKKNLDNIEFGIDRFLQQNPLFCKNFDLDDHTNALIHYAQTDNEAMFEHILGNENENNKNNRIEILKFFGYRFFFSIKDNMYAYRAQIKNVHHVKPGVLYNNSPIISYFDTIRKNLIHPFNIFIKNINVNMKNSVDETALHIAARHGRLDMIKALFNHSADIGAQDITGCSALHTAVSHGQTDVVILLISKGANINGFNYKNSTSLHFAASQGNKDTVQTLITHGACLDTQNKKGSTPLHYAAFNGHYDIVQLLLENGAKADVQDNDNRTALDLASRNGHKIVIQLLKESNPHKEANPPNFVDNIIAFFTT
jgi:ankyrin repeat protein